jgi:hypothetical protein
VGGSVPAVALPAELVFGTRTLELRLRSVLGRGVLSQFALFREARPQRVPLLDADEADQLHYP